MRGDACPTAPGYKNGSDGVYETFDGTAAPTGWTVVDNKDNGQTWKFTDVGNRGNLTGGTGGFAIIDSDKYGSGGAQDTSLVSPVVDLSAVTAPKIKFNQDLNYLSGEKADVDLSIDGGTTWTNVAHPGRGRSRRQGDPDPAGGRQVRRTGSVPLLRRLVRMVVGGRQRPDRQLGHLCSRSAAVSSSAT